jgi:hypothetical protein
VVVAYRDKSSVIANRIDVPLEEELDHFLLSQS